MPAERNREALYSKLGKLVELEKSARCVGSIAEAHAAAAAIQRLLLRYDLKMAELSTEKEQEFNFTLGRFFPQADAYGSRWRISLMACLAKHNRCRCVRKNDGTVTALGTEEDVTAVCNLFCYLTEAFVRFARNEKSKRSFLNGCVMGLNIQLASVVAHEETTSTTLTIPELNARYERALDDYIQKKSYKTHNLEKLNNIDYGAYHRGIEKGKTVSLNRQIEENPA